MSGISFLEVLKRNSLEKDIKNNNINNLDNELLERLDGDLEMHPGWFIFEDRYQDHIIDINSMIEDYCLDKIVPIYQFGNSYKLTNLIIDYHPKLIEKIMQEGERQMRERERLYNKSDEENDYYDEVREEREDDKDEY